MIHNVMHADVFDKLNSEIEWIDDVSHFGGIIPRRFALQASIVSENDIETVPLYRHPMDRYIKELNFSPTVESIRVALETTLGCKLNHAIIQCYRNGEDYISEHADKTLDVAEDSLIVNYTAGQTRVLKLRSKDPIAGKHEYDIQNFDLVNDSAFVLDLEHNRLYKHSIRQNANINNARISITFRNIHTFYLRQAGNTRKSISGSQECQVLSIFGKGYGDKSTCLTKEELYKAWSTENHSSNYTWNDLYSRGYSEIGCFTGK